MELQRTKSRFALKTSTTQNVNREIGEIYFSIDQNFPDFFLRFIVNKLCMQNFTIIGQAVPDIQGMTDVNGY